MLRPVHIQAKRQRPQDPKHDEQGPTEARKFLQKRPGHGVVGRCAPGTQETMLEAHRHQEAHGSHKR